MEVVRAIPEMWAPGLTKMLEANSIWPADDPYVLAHPEWFTDDLEPILNRTGPAVKGKRTTASQPLIEAQ